ncbi:hypothetical protein CALCODRAFT_521771 [Calocera cornea HHB12733]|uniref:AttH domain-containing protein n=1 Tax=Calocera cornea HHB12733 TaxID=1353952 RepID=A0A165CH23_9BASI|nr:hypothetical protein CALCODRAFT_521771 [Calocera cornea HHB12733]
MPTSALTMHLSFLSAVGMLGLANAVSVAVIPPYPVNGTSAVQFALDGPFDAPKTDFFNQSTFQWWYFDALSEDLKQSIVFTFYANTAAASGVVGSPFNGLTLNLQLANGSMPEFAVPSEAILMATVGEGLSAIMNGTGYSWYESSDLSFVYIDINDKFNNITGSFQIASGAPHHAMCGPATEGASLLVIDGLGWANSIPDGTALIDLNVNGEKFKFKGVGYHDSNWGVQASSSSESAMWYWGHARVGPYSIVWSDVLDIAASKEFQSGYVAKHGEIISDSCGNITVRPTGQNSTWPPIPGQQPSGFHIVYDMGGNGVLDVNITNSETISYEPLAYSRWVGSTVGGIQGQDMYKGVALYEWEGG